MKRLIPLFAALSLSVAPAFADAHFVKGKVKKLDAEGGKVTLIHEELTSLDMPAMTMVFVLADPAMAGMLSEGAELEFAADRVNGKLTVTELR
ncbi:copper-binding protein [Tranquillimonas alkanivorans]|uniref:Cu and Ag efflux protein CusF n=1 Tax=Tranquillimonas alkanivorans TaxID=441119 RepID=A0A1I5V523_9RHOB|nr:copper-binding protein [Tranquillimonas alkanivorans]SFQ02609.1 Cu and Ag efflux protein CusF [Tranquillimonas alkanivorans]